MAPTPVIALPWYHQDAGDLRRMVDAWLRRAELTEKQLQKAGFGVARIWIRPVPFAAWCEGRNVAPDQSARLTFAGDAVRDLPAWC